MCDRPDIYEGNIHTARIKHVCCECQTTVNPGSKYVRVSVCIERKFYHFKQCLDCNQIGDRYAEKTDGCYPLGDLYGELAENNFLKYDRVTKQWNSAVDWIKVVSSNPLKLAFVEVQEKVA